MMLLLLLLLQYYDTKMRGWQLKFKKAVENKKMLELYSLLYISNWFSFKI